MNVRTVGRMLMAALAGWWNHKDSRLAAAIAYYTIFSLAPLLVIVVAVAGAVFGEAAARGELDQQIANLVGKEAIPLIDGMIEGAGRFRSGLFAWGAGIVALFIGATGVFAALRDALATVWEVEQQGGLRGIVKDRVVSFLGVLALGVLLLALLTTSSTLSLFVKITGVFPGLNQLVSTVNFLFSFAVVTCVFAFAYKILISVKLWWGDVWTGAAFTSLLFTVGKLLMGIYLGSGRIRSIYGAASSVIVLLFWVYFSAQVFLFGAEFIRVYVAATRLPANGKKGRLTGQKPRSLKAT
jgi:membrane protein